MSLTTNKSVVPYQYSLSWLADALLLGEMGGSGGDGFSVSDCPSFALMTGVRFHQSDAITSIGVECVPVGLSASNDLVETGARFYPGAFGGELTPPEPQTPASPPQFEFGGPTGTPGEYHCPAGQYIAALLEQSVTLGSTEVVQTILIHCEDIGIEKIP